MVAPSKIEKARRAANRQARTRQMAQVMRHHRFGPQEACSLGDLRNAGFSEAEIGAYQDDAINLLRGTPPAVLEAAQTRLEGRALVEQAQAIRARMARDAR